jgi:hypothetical protein
MHVIVRGRDQLIDFACVVGIDRHTDACAEPELTVLEHERLGDAFGDALAHRFDARAVIDRGEDHSEFVAADARGGV